MSDLLSMVTLKDRWKQLLMAPTIDKATSLFATMMLGFFVLCLFSPVLTGRDIQYELMIIIGIAFLVSTFITWWFKKYDQPARDQESARLQAEIDHDYLLKNPKLKETEIKLDCLEQIMNEMSIMRQLLAAALNNKEGNVDRKYYDPNLVNTMHDTPWSTVHVSSYEAGNVGDDADVASEESSEKKPES